MNLRRLGAAIACATVVVVALAACGDDDDSGDGDGTEASTAPSAAAPEGPAIKLGSFCSCSGAQESVLGGSDTVIEAWAAHVNESGGLNGHPVDVTVIDDGGDPARALQAAKELVEQEKVSAIVGTTSLADAAIGPYLSQQGIPVVGGASPNATFLTNPDWFPSGSNLVALVYGTVDEASKGGGTNLGVMYCAESPVCAQLVPLAEGIGQIVGIDVTPAKISATAPNYTAECLSMQDDGVDALFVADNGPVIQRVLASCAQQNFDPLAVGQATTSTTDYLSDANLDGSLNSGTNANPYDDSLPAVAEFRDALDAYEEGFTDSEEFTYDSILPWSGGVLFEAAAKAGKLGPDSTPEDVKNALYQLKGETLEGLSEPLTFRRGQPTFTSCWFTTKIEDGELLSENNNEPSCLTPEQATQLQQALPAG